MTTFTSKPKQWQADFAESLFKGLSQTLASGLNVESSTEQQQRFAIYQNNVFYSLSNALADLYPCIKKLVGDDFFNGTANAYIRKHPPAQAAMVNFGWDFAEFLSHFEHTKDMAYLADMARLELSRHQAYHAADGKALSQKDFANINPALLEQACVRLHPSLHLMESRFPLFSIWEANQEMAEASQQSIDLDEPQWLIVVRFDYEVLTFKVDDGTYLFYRNMLNGQSIIQAATEAQTHCPDTDISAALALGITKGFFTHIDL